MRHIFIVLCFFVSNFGISQKNDKMDDLVVLALKKAADTTNIVSVKNILDDTYFKYKQYFNYIPSINPLNPKKYKRISSKYGKRFHPIDNIIKQHLGLDISAKKGTAIHSSASGTVIDIITSNYGYGNQVLIEHKFGFTTRYAHLHSFIIKKGDTVSKGKIIGFVGNSGKSTGSHLHYEILKDNKAIDPYPFCFLNLDEK